MRDQGARILVRTPVSGLQSAQAGSSLHPVAI
jgi:hypothetical protein